MLKLILSLIIFSFQAYAEGQLTPKQAEELGMTELKKYREEVLQKKQKNNELGRNLYDDEVNSTLATVVVIVNESDRSETNPEGQTAKLYHHGQLINTFDVSTGSRKIKKTTNGREYIAITPEGFWRPKKAYKDYYSYTFFGSTMPYAIFYHGGIALHGTTAIKKLGKRDSGGCVRFHPNDIEKINQLMRTTGDQYPKMSYEKLCRDFLPNGKLVTDTENLTVQQYSTRCIKRSKYLDRTQLADVDQKTGFLNEDIIWTYDSLIIVKKP